MIYRILADLTLVVHFAFILFVVLGGLLVAWRRRVAWVHVPAALWGALITFVGWRCPLTPLELRLRELGGEAGYTESFVEHYLLSVIYPQGIPEAGWIALGVGVVVVNALVYLWVFRWRGVGQS
ncbi:MAG: DUF2784 domain-containing protein [Gemmatimonadales bacterium]|nr:MAG: DUF2784 domain-containing protein [Gemmatimonadales bacterium]